MSCSSNDAMYALGSLRLSIPKAGSAQFKVTVTPKTKADGAVIVGVYLARGSQFKMWSINGTGNQPADPNSFRPYDVDSTIADEGAGNNTRALSVTIKNPGQGDSIEDWNLQVYGASGQKAKFCIEPVNNAAQNTFTSA